MKYQRLIWTLGILVAGMIGLLFESDTRALAQTVEANGESDVEILTRGPVHEAFAEPVTYNPTQGVVVTGNAPALIEEIPPEDKPEGDNVHWIPGYWSWDVDRGDFIWISGIWRDAPPDRSWVPGYWTPVTGGWIWTPGFWMSTESEEVEYLPQPPESLEVGPSSHPPSVDHLWAAGCWFWIGSRYAWRPGYWVSANPDWVWQPAHYVWTPRGYVYVDGYWDRTLERRGVLFAPMYVHHSVYSRPHYVYRPSIMIQVGFLTVALFDSPNSHHYYFGDYYDVEYSRRGFRPWFEVDQRHRGYDPIFAHQRWHHGRTDIHWERNVRKDYTYRQEHVEARPSRTYSTQAAVAARAPKRERKNLVIAAPLGEVSRRNDAPFKFEKIDETRRKTLGGQAKEVTKFRAAREQWESKPKSADRGESIKDQPQRSPEVKRPDREMPKDVKSDKKTNDQPQQAKKISEPPMAQRPSSEPVFSKPEKVKIPKSPVIGKRNSAPGKAGNPPVRPDMPKTEPNIKSKPADKAKTEPNVKSKPADDKGKPGDKVNSKDKAPAPSDTAPSDGKNQDKKDKDKSEGKNRDK